MPLAKPAGSPRIDYMPLQNLKEHPRTDYMPCNTCVPYCYLIIFRSSHRHTEHIPDTHNTTLTSTSMGGQTYHHPGKAQHLHQRPWEDQPTTMSDIVILDLDMLRLVMEHRVLRQLHNSGCRNIYKYHLTRDQIN